MTLKDNRVPLLCYFKLNVSLHSHQGIQTGKPLNWVKIGNVLFCVTLELHQPRLWFITGGYLVKRWFITAATRARGQPNDLNREILVSNIFNCHKEVINAPPVPSISRCFHIVYRHKNVWEYQWSNFIYNCMSTFLHYVHCTDALLDCSAPGGERCESLTWFDEIWWMTLKSNKAPPLWHFKLCVSFHSRPWIGSHDYTDLLWWNNMNN